MRNAIMILTTLAAAFLTAAVARAAEPKQQSTKLDTQVPVKLDYLLYLPEGYDQQDKWPVLIFLHGAGERGDDLELVKKHGPPKLIEEGKSFPFIVVSPQCPNGQWWTTKPLELTALVDEIVAKHKVDEERLYLTGLSMGGFGTWMLAAYKPDRFAAIVPICGGGEVLATRALGQMPTWVFHGAKDPVVPLKRSEDMVEALKRVNKEVKFTVYPDALHDSWTETYSNPQLYTWLLDHKRAAPAAAGP
ncbi:MAG: prolyl oligopeptidase family serine peptidase [Pirellulales bacterium]